MHGSLPAGATATDLVFTVIQMLREHGVVGKFVEFHGDGLSELSLADRATISNMSAEFGATCAMFPIDSETIRYLSLTGRSDKQVDCVEAYARKQGLWRNDGDQPARYRDNLELDLAIMEPTSLAPGFHVVPRYLDAAGVLEPLRVLGFHVVVFGYTTCSGNSGPLDEPISKAIKQGNLTATAVLSGYRNFEGRIHQEARANYLASSPLVVAYALAGSLRVDIVNEPLGTVADGEPIFLHEIWPKAASINQAIRRHVSTDLFQQGYKDLF